MLSARMQAAAAVGYGGGQDHEAILAAARVPAGRYSHFVELHIEQVWWPDCDLHNFFQQCTLRNIADDVTCHDNTLMVQGCTDLQDLHKATLPCCCKLVRMECAVRALAHVGSPVGAGGCGHWHCHSNSRPCSTQHLFPRRRRACWCAAHALQVWLHHVPSESSWSCWRSVGLAETCTYLQ